MVDLATPSPNPETRPAAPQPSAGNPGAAIGIVGALVLLDVALETFRRASPFRRWAIGAAVVYLLAAAAGIRMFGQPTVRLLSAVSAAALVMAVVVFVQAVEREQRGAEPQHERKRRRLCGGLQPL
jgi:hypothetical protein